MTQVSLKLAEFTEAVNTMLYDFGRLERLVADYQADVAAVRSTLAERDTITQMLIDDHRAVVAENERLTAENQELREAAETAATVLSSDLAGERVSTTTRHSLVRWLTQLAAADDEQHDNVPAYTEETG